MKFSGEPTPDNASWARMAGEAFSGRAAMHGLSWANQWRPPGPPGTARPTGLTATAVSPTAVIVGATAISAGAMLTPVGLRTHREICSQICQNVLDKNWGAVSLPWHANAQSRSA